MIGTESCLLPSSQQLVMLARGTLSKEFRIMTLASADKRSPLPTEFITHKWETEAPTELFDARSLKFINVMQTQAFQPIKLLMLCESTLE